MFGFKVGDRVRIAYTNTTLYGKLGTVVSIRDSWVNVDLDDGRIGCFSEQDSLVLIRRGGIDKETHKETILAWLNGSDVERFDMASNMWVLDDNPKFEYYHQYRVKEKVRICMYRPAKIKYKETPLFVECKQWDSCESHEEFICWLGEAFQVEFPED